jgi:hypothetical protein
MKMFSKLFFAVMISSLLFVSCSKDDEIVPTLIPKGNYETGFFVVNEGSFGDANGSISYATNEFKSENNVFSLVNPSLKIGDTPQSIAFNGDLAYILVNVSNKIEVVNRYTFKSVATITSGLVNPRYMSFANGKGYITNWGDANITTDDYVAVLNLTNNKIEFNISVVEGPEKIIENNGNLYVAQQGGYGQGNSISIISSDTNTVTKNMVVGDVPVSLEKNNGTLYVLCKGRPSYADPETAGKLVKISLRDNALTSTTDFGGVLHPSNFVIDNNKGYYTIGKEVYTIVLNTTELPSTALFTALDKDKTLYGFDVKNNNFYIAGLINYSDPGSIFVYDLSGKFTTQFEVGINPNGFYFNE